MVKGVPVMAAPGEIDASNADWLRTTLLETAARGHATFVVDMTRTRLCASAGLGALVQAHKRALAEGAELRLLMPTSAAVLRVFALTGSGQPGASNSGRQVNRKARPKGGQMCEEPAQITAPILQQPKPSRSPNSHRCATHPRFLGPGQVMCVHVSARPRGRSRVRCGAAPV